MSCHDSDTKKGGIDLEQLLDAGNVAHGEHVSLWVRLEKAVARGEMPPENKKPLEPAQKQAIESWFHEAFVLRDGKAHIGATPLRRLTRFEFENTLEEVLAISLKAPYRATITGRIETSAIASIVPSDIPGESGFGNDAHRLGKLKPPLKELADGANYALAKFSQSPAAISTVLGRKDIPKNPSPEAVKGLISRFLVRAYRGDDARLADNVETYYNRYRKHLQESKDGGASLLHVFEMVLVSPEFLYRLEQSRDQDEPYPVTGLELAIRLSYFLWARPPDAELLKLGRDGSLFEDEVLMAQVNRMLDSPKRIALAENFAGQWLGFGDLITDGEYLRNERWNREAYDEVLFFVDELIRSNRSVLELVQSDWLYKRASALRAKGHGYQKADPGSMKRVHADIFANRQSKSRKGKRQQHYDPPVLVKPKDDREGGILTSPAIMRVTASKTRTSPIRRGVWVLETLVGKEMEVPEDVPSLDEARDALTVKRNPTVAELIKQHVAKPVCQACHKEIDPLGLGLENFGQFGDWRTHYPDKAPVVASGTMPNGKTFTTPGEMKTLLIELYRDDIAENVARRLFAYALGRKLEPYDRVSLDQILSQAKADGYKTNTFIKEIVLSPQFRCRQDR